MKHRKQFFSVLLATLLTLNTVPMSIMAEDDLLSDGGDQETAILYEEPAGDMFEDLSDGVQDVEEFQNSMPEDVDESQDGDEGLQDRNALFDALSSELTDDLPEVTSGSDDFDPATQYLIRYHINDNAEASDSTAVTYGTLTKTKTIEELGYIVQGKKFAGWKVYRDHDQTWRVENSSGTQSWAKTVPSGGKYVLYTNGNNSAKTAPAGATVHFYAQWEDTTEYTIYYHKDETSPYTASSKVTYGTTTKIKTVDELGYVVAGKKFAGWKAYRDHDQTWRVQNSSGTQSWSKTVPSGGKYYLYTDGSNSAKTTPAGTVVHFYAQWESASEYTIYYHLNDTAAASRTTTKVTYGTSTKTKTVEELGFSVSGKKFEGWKVYRESDQCWRVQNSSGTQSWSKTVPSGGKYVLYTNGNNSAKTAPAGDKVHFYAQWDIATEYTIYYHLDDTAAASSITTKVTYGVVTKTKTSEELGFSVNGKEFEGWKVYRESDQCWRVQNSSGVASWSKSVPSGGKYVLYTDGNNSAKTAPAGDKVHFYGQWKGATEYTIYYHLDDTAAASSTITKVTYGTTTKTKTTSELGFAESGKKFSGWKVYRESDQCWRVQNSSGTQSWSKTVPSGGKYVLYTDGNNSAKTAPAGDKVHFYGQWEAATEYTIYYHLDDTAAASSITTKVTYGTSTKTKTTSELGFVVSGKKFSGWKVYRESDQCWRVQNSSGVASWSKTVPSGGKYVLYTNGNNSAKTAPAGDKVHFYGQWEYDDIELNGILYRLVDDVMTVVGYKGTASSYVVEEVVNGKTVKVIGKEAFYNNTNLTSIDLPDTIEIIGVRAFAGCINLSTMN